MVSREYQIAAGNAGWRLQFSFAVHVLWSRVPELWTFAVSVRMIAFDDKRWEGLKGGYKVLYDPRPALRELESGSPVEPIWKELWEDLHHQGDIGEASYCSVTDIALQ